MCICSGTLRREELAEALLSLQTMVLPTRPPMPLRTAVNIAELSNPTYIGEPQYTGAWKGCAYDPELPPQSAPGGLYHMDQVKVKAELVDVVREWSKEVIRGGFHVNQDPEGMIAFSRDWFAQKAAEFAAESVVMYSLRRTPNMDGQDNTSAVVVVVGAEAEAAVAMS